MGLLIIALTGPRAGNKNTQIRKEGISIMVVVDTSSSMRALDLSDEKDRLAILKEKLGLFIRGGRGLAGREMALGLFVLLVLQIPLVHYP